MQGVARENIGDVLIQPAARDLDPLNTVIEGVASPEADLVREDTGDLGAGHVTGGVVDPGVGLTTGGVTGPRHVTGGVTDPHHVTGGVTGPRHETGGVTDPRHVTEGVADPCHMTGSTATLEMGVAEYQEMGLGTEEKTETKVKGRVLVVDRMITSRNATHECQVLRGETKRVSRGKIITILTKMVVRAPSVSLLCRI